MKKLLIAASLICLMTIQQVHAVVAWYQPTPFPSKKEDGSLMPQEIYMVHQWSGWFNNSYNQYLVQDDKLQIGGWGDSYFSVLQFDLIGLPIQVINARLYLYILPSNAANPSQVAMFPIKSMWQPSTIGINNFPSVDTGIAWSVSPTTNIWGSFDINQWYSQWKNASRINNGILIYPWNNDDTQRFTTFVSSRSSDDGKRPLLRLEFNQPSGMPQFKMPVPGNASWKLTNEIGGYESQGESPWPDIAHQGNTYYSLDISPTNRKDAGGSYTGSIPILAAADGIVAYVGTDRWASNGFHIVLNHSGYTSTTNGYTSKYIHFDDIPRHSNGTALKVGDRVYQGDQIGIMGTTGNPSTGVHLHFGVYYNGSGASSVPELSYVVVDGWLMKSFHTESAINSNGTPTGRIRYYRSSNRVY